MKKSLMAVALLGAFAGVAQAQTAVQIYGQVDAGLVKQSGQTLSIGKRASNTLGFKGTEDLGNGLKALFHLEIRYEPDTGTLERTNRPLFQGQSRVGLQGDFGMVRIGRGLTPFQETIGAFDPWHAVPTAGGFYTDLTVAGYNSQPLDPRGTGNNRWANAFWYNSPVVGGFQLNTAIATKENNGGPASAAGRPTASDPLVGRGTTALPQYPVGAQASANPFSATGTYNNGPVAVMFGYERNAIETKVYAVGLSFMVTPALKLMSTATRQDQGNTVFGEAKTRAWVLGANYALGPGKVLAGYGQKDPDARVNPVLGPTKTKQMSLGYEYSLSKRTYLYVDASRRENPVNAQGQTRGVNYYDLGVNHSF